jgi:Ca2+-binding RTX toxin-like protein
MHDVSMRRLQALVIAAAVALLVVSGALLFGMGKPAQAQSAHIVGTPQDDVLLESPQDDIIIGLAGNDVLDASLYTGDKDVLRGGRGNDVLDATDGDFDDTLNGGSGFDQCFGDIDDTFISCEIIVFP